MRIWIALISALIMFAGCGDTSPKPKAVAKQAPLKKFAHFAQNMGNDVFYMNKETLLTYMQTKPQHLQSNERLLQKALLETKIVSKDESGFTLNPFGTMRLHGDISAVKSLAFNARKNEYLVSGSWFEETIYAGNPPNVVAKNFSFILAYDASSGELKGFYHNQNASKYNYITIAPSGDMAFLEYFSRGILIDIQNQKTIAIQEPKNLHLSSTKDSFSKDGNFLALIGSTGETSRLTIFNTKNGQIVYQGEATGVKSSPKYTFSKDGSRFLIAYKEKPFITILDMKTKAIAQSPKSSDASVYISAFDSFATLSVWPKDIYKFQDTYKSQHLVLDIKKNSIICEAPQGNFVIVYDAKYDKDKNILTTIGHNRLSAYVIDGNECILAKEEKYKTDDFLALLADIAIKDNELIIISDKGELQTVKIQDISLGDDEILMAKNTAAAKKLLDAGFEKRGLDALEQIVKNPDYDSFKNSYSMLINYLNISYEAYIQLLAFERYKSEGRDFATDKDFQRSLRNYIFIASATGFKELLPAAIKTYESLIGANPGKDQKDMLALYRAMYLLDINKDDEAYDLLFDQAPFGKDAVHWIKNYSSWKTGLMKDSKKLSIATGVSESDLSKRSRKRDAKFLYDMEKNKVQKGEMPKSGDLSTKPISPKQEAIRLLD